MIALASAEGTFVPTRPQHDLLRAALLADRAEVAAAFTRWKEVTDFERIEVGTLRMVPLLYRNLQRHGIEDALTPRMKGIYRQVWFRNQLILQEAFESLRALREEGIPALVIKGAALVTTVYEDPALRPMEDFDIVVPRREFHRAVESVMRLGWRMVPEPADLEPHLEFHHAVSLSRGTAGELDLHWWTTYGVFDRTGEQEFWSGSSEVDLGGTVARVLAPPDQLLQMCVHAAQRNLGVAPIRWVADAVFLLARSGESFDWDRLVALARTRSQSLVQLRCLEYLRDGLGLQVPDAVLAALRENVRFGEGTALALRHSRRSVYRWYAALIWIRLLFIDGGRAVPRRLLLLRRYIRSAFRVPSGMPLPVFVIRRIFTRPVASAGANRDTTRP